ncbi:hypothetical protein ACFXJ5_17060 [Streptomyces sp. NPDC059373]
MTEPPSGIHAHDDGHVEWTRPVAEWTDEEVALGRDQVEARLDVLQADMDTLVELHARLTAEMDNRSDIYAEVADALEETAEPDSDPSTPKYRRAPWRRR